MTKMQKGWKAVFALNGVTRTADKEIWLYIEKARKTNPYVFTGLLAAALPYSRQTINVSMKYFVSLKWLEKSAQGAYYIKASFTEAAKKLGKRSTTRPLKETGLRLKTTGCNRRVGGRP